ncbi:MAG: ribosome silencing factor [Bacteroidia bacterium]|nr:ribosome silencing factor [Bacteroidia bacterium]MDW8135110.1 ribosome silencing factor [Bacteroidia bacterium]
MNIPYRVSLSTQQRLEITLKALSDKKGENLVVLDLREIGYPLSDYFVIATAESDRQAQALSDHIIEKLKEAEGSRIGYRIEGYEVGKWILLDLNDIIVHIFQPEVREYYKIEELWGDARVVQA